MSFYFLNSKFGKMKNKFLPVKIVPSVLFILLMLMLSNITSAQEVVNYTIAGPYTFTPPEGVTQITVEAWGGGGKGGSTTQTYNQPAAGGGGGAYVKSIIPVNPLQIYYLSVGTGSSTLSDGKSSYFGTALGDSSILIAKGGLSCPDDTNTPVGTQTGSDGDIIHIGGLSAYGNWGGMEGNFGGGGGSSGGTDGNGNYTAPTQTLNGGSVHEGGTGGNGGFQNANGLPGEAPGGGGGGAVSNNNMGGAGAKGMVRITYYINPPDGTWTNDVGDGNWSTAGNWYGGEVPDMDLDVIIPAESDVANISLYNDPSAPALCNDLTIENGGTLTVDGGNYLTVYGSLNNDGTLNLNSDASGIASLMVDEYHGGGTNNIGLYLTGNAWHYISIPVASVPSALFSGRPETAVNGYFENLVTEDFNTGWVSSIGYHYNPGTGEWDWEPGLAWSPLSNGKGYNYYSTSTTDPPINITGTPDVDGVSISLKYNSAGGSGSHQWPEQQGYNFIGNPFTCGMDWDVVYNYNTIWTNVESAIYFKRNDITYTYTPGDPGITVPDDLGPGNQIPPMQGFFIKANTSASLTIPPSSKIHTGHVRYKSKTIVPQVRLELEHSGNSDQTVIAFNNNATSAFDNNFDARKLLDRDNASFIYSSLEGTEYTINTVPYPENDQSIPLVINANTEGQYTIMAKQLQGLENYKVYLLDKEQDFKIDLSVNKSYSFASSPGIFTDRFVLIISGLTKSVPENIIQDKPFNIYSLGDVINIQTLSDEWNGRTGEIRIFDLTGRIISNKSNITLSEDVIMQLPVRGDNGIYIVRINSGQMNFVSKVFVK